MCCDFCDLSTDDQWTTLLSVLPLGGGIALATQMAWARRQTHAIQQLLCWGPAVLLVVAFYFAMRASWTVRDHDLYRPIEGGGVKRVEKWTSSQMWAWCGKRTCCFVVGLFVWLSAAAAVLATTPGITGSPTAAPTA